MIAKAVVIWWALTMVIMMWRSLNKSDKSASKMVAKSVLIAAAISAILLSAVMFLNNLSGI